MEGEDLACHALKFVFLYRFFCNQQSFSRGIKSNTNIASVSYHIKQFLTLIHLFPDPKTNTCTFDLKVILLSFYGPLKKAIHITRNWFLALSNSKLKVVSLKNYFKVGIILEVYNDVVVETCMAERYVADYTNTSLHGFAYFVLQALVGWVVNMVDD